MNIKQKAQAIIKQEKEDHLVAEVKRRLKEIERLDERKEELEKEIEELTSPSYKAPSGQGTSEIMDTRIDLDGGYTIG